MTNVWLPENQVRERYSFLKQYGESQVYLMRTPGHHESMICLYGLSDIPLLEMESQVLEGAYDRGVITQKANLALRLCATPNEPHRVIGIEYPIFGEPFADEVPARLLEKIKSNVSGLKEFNIAYMLVMDEGLAKMFRDSHLCENLLVGNIREKKNPKVPQGFIRHPIGDNVVADSIPPRGWRGEVNHYFEE